MGGLGLLSSCGDLPIEGSDVSSCGDLSSRTDERARSARSKGETEPPVAAPSRAPLGSAADGVLCCADSDAAAAIGALLRSLSLRCASPFVRMMMPVVTSPVCAMNELGTTSSACSSAHTSSRNASVHSRKHETERT